MRLSVYEEQSLSAPSQGYSVIFGSAVLHENGGNFGSLVGHPIGVVCVDLGNACHLKAVLVKSCKGRNQAGKGAADGELGNAVIGENLNNGIDVFVPNDFGEVDMIIACIDALAVCPECGAVDAILLKVCCLLCNGSFKKINSFIVGGSLGKRGKA